MQKTDRYTSIAHYDPRARLQMFGRNHTNVENEVIGSERGWWPFKYKTGLQVAIPDLEDPKWDPGQNLSGIAIMVQEINPLVFGEERRFRQLLENWAREHTYNDAVRLLAKYDPTGVFSDANTDIGVTVLNKGKNEDPSVREFKGSGKGVSELILASEGKDLNGAHLGKQVIIQYSPGEDITKIWDHPLSRDARVRAEWWNFFEKIWDKAKKE